MGDNPGTKAREKRAKTHSNRTPSVGTSIGNVADGFLSTVAAGVAIPYDTVVSGLPEADRKFMDRLGKSGARMRKRVKDDHDRRYGKEK